MLGGADLQAPGNVNGREERTVGCGWLLQEVLYNSHGDNDV